MQTNKEWQAAKPVLPLLVPLHFFLHRFSSKKETVVVRVLASNVWVFTSFESAIFSVGLVNVAVSCVYKLN